jgi:hypothetical protein
MARPLSFANIVLALVHGQRAFLDLGFGLLGFSHLGEAILPLVLAALVLRGRALIAAAAALAALKLFFFFIYPGSVRHSALFIMLMIALLWIEAGRLQSTESPRLSRMLESVGNWSMVLLLSVQAYSFARVPLFNTMMGRPLSHAADLGAILRQPEYRSSYLMIDPDALGESVVYWTGRPNWLIRVDRPGTVTPFTMTANRWLTLDRLIEQAERVHRTTGAPVIIALKLDINSRPAGAHDVMFKSFTILEPAALNRFKAATRKIATLRRSWGDERYDVYVYPR